MDELLMRLHILTRTATFILLLMIAALFVLKLYFAGYIPGKKRKQPFKTTSLNSADGLIFGKNRFGQIAYSPASDEGHCAVFGGSGSGKTSSILIPTLRHWSGTSLSIDISGDISANVDCPNKLIYEPGNPISAPYNVFSMIDELDDIDDKNEALEQLAFLIIPEQDNANANAKYFLDGGRNILAASLIAFYHTGLDFSEICQTILGNSYLDLFKKIKETNNVTASFYISNFQGNSEQNVSGCKQSCDMSIKLFAVNKKVANSIRRPNCGEVAFSPETVETHNVFILIPDDKRSVYSPLLHIITSQVLSYFSARSGRNNNILLCLDEFASLGKLDITDALRKLRKKHIRILVLTQNLSDIEDIYGRGAYKSMLSNFKYTVLLGVGESETQEYFSKLIGREDKRKESSTSAGILGGQISRTSSTEKDYIIQPADLNRLGDSLILLHPNGYTKLRKAYYYK